MSIFLLLRDFVYRHYYKGGACTNQIYGNELRAMQDSHGWNKRYDSRLQTKSPER